MSPHPAADHPDETVRREVELDAPVHEVWRALSGEEGLAGWLADEVALDVVPGAVGTVRDGDGPRRPVRVDEVREGRGLALVWADEAGLQTLVDIALTPVEADREGPDGEGPSAGDRTRVVVVEVPLVLVSAVAVEAARSLVAATGGASGSGASASASRALAGVR